MNLIYFTHYNLEDKNYYGVKEKIFSQYNAFNKHIKTGLIYFDNYNMIFLNEKEEKKLIAIFKNKLKKRTQMYNFLYNVIKENNIKNLYIRYPYTDFYFINFLKKIKSKKIFLEIPTYPFHNEDKRLKARITYLIETFYIGKLKKYIDYIVTFSDHDEIFGIPTIKIENGIDLNKIELRKPVKHENINLLGVAKVSKWHGYDRVIKGLYEYYNNNPSEKVYFHVVGEGEELNNLKELSNKLKLENYIIFHGFKKGKELNELFNIADIGIGSLGNHRKGIYKESALKNREYCAKGLPFILSSIDNDFPENFKYVYYISQEETPLNINKIKNFYNKIKNENYIKEMRKYAENNLSWEIKLNKIITRIKGD